MAKIADVLQTERNRQASTEWNKIHLFQMGDFYRAYEWSAWLISVITYNDKVRNQTRDRRQLFDTDNFARIVEIDGDMLTCRAA